MPSYLRPELVERLLVVFKRIPKLANTAKDAFSLAQVLSSILRTVEAAAKALDVIYKPRSELFACKAVLILSYDRELDGAKLKLGRGTFKEI